VSIKKKIPKNHESMRYVHNIEWEDGGKRRPELEVAQKF